MFGRFEMFTFSVFLSVLSLILLAACQNIQTYFVSPRAPSKMRFASP
jgi:hypothetical protein